eukprot:6200136-Pleurochrysis_carterae.AAC.4
MRKTTARCARSGISASLLRTDETKPNFQGILALAIAFSEWADAGISKLCRCSRRFRLLSDSHVSLRVHCLP